MKRGVLITLGFILLAFAAVRCRLDSHDPALVGAWISLDSSNRRIVFFPDGRGAETADVTEPNLRSHQDFGWSTAFGRISLRGYDEEGGSQPIGSADYMIRKGMLSLVGDLPEDWSSAYRFERSLESLPK